MLRVTLLLRNSKGKTTRDGRYKNRFRMTDTGDDWFPLGNENAMVIFPRDVEEYERDMEELYPSKSN